MPDALTHIAGVAWLGPLWRRPELRLALYLGAIVPDLSAKVLDWGLDAGFAWIVPTHSLAGILLYAYGLAHLWPERDRAAVFGLFGLGSAVHVALDALKAPLGSWNVFPLAPFWNGEVALRWIETEHTLLGAPVCLAGVLFLEWRLRRAPS